MLILGIESATEQVGVAIGGHEGVIATFEVTRGRRHAEILTPAIEFVLRNADIDVDELGCIAVDIGPGMFTGMRVGISAAKAMAQALRIPMIGISSLDLLAFPCRHTDRVVVPVIDARGRTVAALNTGVAAVQAEPADLARDYLPALLKVQEGLRRVIH